MRLWYLTSLVVLLAGCAGFELEPEQVDRISKAVGDAAQTGAEIVSQPLEPSVGGNLGAAAGALAGLLAAGTVRWALRKWAMSKEKEQENLVKRTKGKA